MKRLWLVAFLLAPSMLDADQSQTCAINVLVGEHKSVDVVVHCMNKEQIVELISGMFSRGDEAAKVKFNKVLGESGEMTLTITSKRGD